MGGYYTFGHRQLWIEDRAAWNARQGAPVLVLHGGLDHSASMLGALDDTLRTTFRLVAFDRAGHGRSPATNGCFDYADMADQIITVIENYVGMPVHVLGASDGANSALIAALQRPELFASLTLGGGNFHHRGLITHGMPERSELGRSFAASSTGQLCPEGPEQAARNAEATWDLWHSGPTLTPEQLQRLHPRTLVLVGDDEPVDLRHTVELYESIPNGQLAVVPGTSHAALMEKPKLYAHLVAEFIANPEPPQTLQPVRRSQ